ncbi:STM4015 family protein [uncultured Streptomyces sp.]|uniref:STM4015 family protein n=1 Tax=uncultured Streptomyces sp. TaxID=174707 RepID=UPI0026383EFA|nr:STM4015 family protein [uncultured Streptomyces sp.]
MSGVDNLRELHGLPVVDFEHGADGSTLPAADAVAWRVRVNPYDDDDPTWEKVFERFLESVDPAGVRALVVGQWGESYEEDSSYPIGLIVAAADRLTSLEAVFIGDMTYEESEISWIQQSDVTVLLTAFPHLVELGVRGSCEGEEGELRFPPVAHAGLRSLTLESGGLPAEAVRGVLDSDLPALERLELWLGVSGYGGTTGLPDLAPLLSGTRFPRLEHLGLRNSEIQNEIAAAVASAPVVARLRTLDLSNGVLGDEGAAALLEGQPLTHLDVLDLHHHFLSEEMEARLTASLAPHGVRLDLSERNKPWGDGGRANRYTAVAE